jgi:3-phenylpropionate/trans-cinnamate dioxygenase ferredoxin reductase subunit
VKARSAVVIGAGFIGCEAAASLAMRGVTTTLVAPDQVPQAKRLGEQTGERIKRLLGDTGVRYAGSVSVDSLAEGAVRLDDTTTIECDLVVDAHMRTSVENVYAAGDVALAYNSLAGRPVAVEHWQDAVDQGEIAGAAAAGQTREWDAVPGFWTTIGEATLKYHAWGDGFDRARFVDHGGGFTVWYERDHATVGVLTLNADEDYDRGEELIQRKLPIPH